VTSRPAKQEEAELRADMRTWPKKKSASRLFILAVIMWA